MYCCNLINNLYNMSCSKEFIQTTNKEINIMSKKVLSSIQQEQKLMKVKLTTDQIQSIVSTLNPVEVVEQPEVVIPTDQQIMNLLVEEGIIPDLNVVVATSLEYVKWSDTSDEETVHIGVLTVEDEDTVTLLTKYGEMTFMKNDGLFEPSTREQFERVVIPVKEQEVKVVGDSKMSKATLIYQEMIKVATNRRIDIIRKIMSELDMSLSGASTYHQTIKVKLSK